MSEFFPSLGLYPIYNTCLFSDDIALGLTCINDYLNYMSCRKMLSAKLRRNNRSYLDISLKAHTSYEYGHKMLLHSPF